MNKNDVVARWKEVLKPTRFRQESKTLAHDGRNPFERDYARLVFSSSIRRLQDKAQVFPLEKSDFIRTRLTHSLEVSTIARSIGQSIERNLILNNDGGKVLYGQLTSILACAGLVHDLGNPPFGHFGEEVIQSFFQRYFYEEGNKIKDAFSDWRPEEIADFENFDGNVQTFRILRKLSYLKDEYSFNLTYPTLASIIKYPRNSTSGNKKHSNNIADKKFGFFQSEQEDYVLINKELKLNEQRHPIVFLMEAADDIAYSAADLEDGVKVGSLNFDVIFEVFKKHLDKTGQQRKLLDNLSYYYKKFYKSNQHDRLGLTIQRFRIDSQGYMIGAIIEEFEKNQKKILGGKYSTELLKSSPARNVREAFKDLSYIYFDHKVIIERELIGQKVLKGLLEIYLEVAFSKDFKSKSNSLEGRLYKMVSSNFRLVHETFPDQMNNRYRKIQLITDYLSGMTDSYALDVYQKLSGIKL